MSFVPSPLMSNYSASITDHSSRPPLTLATSCDHTAKHQEKLTWTLKSWAESRHGNAHSEAITFILSENYENKSVERNCHTSQNGRILTLTKPHLLDHILLTKLILLEFITHTFSQICILPTETESTMTCHLLSKTNKSTDQSTHALP